MRRLLSLALFSAIALASPAAHSQQQPATWKYSIPAGVSTATYPGDVNVSGKVTVRPPNVKCDGQNDDTAAINAALTANVGRVVQLPSGICVYNGGGVLGDGTILLGQGPNSTILRVGVAAPASLLNASGFGAQIHNIGIVAGVTQTGGTWVTLQGTESRLSNFRISGDFNGVKMVGVGATLSYGRMENGAVNSNRIVVNSGDSSEIIDNILIGQDSPVVSNAGILVQSNAALIISNTSVISQGTGLLIKPDNGQNVASLWVHDSFFDNSKNHGISINPVGTGSVTRLRFANVWAASSATGNGVQIVNGGTGALTGIHFVDLHAILNAGSGVTTNGVVSDLEFTGGEFGGNNFGFYLASGTDSVIINGAHVGSYGGVAGNVAAGINLASGVTNAKVVNSFVSGNTGPNIVDNMGNVAKTIYGNTGYNPLSGTLTVGASPYSYTNYSGAPQTVFVTGGTVSAVTLDGKTVAAATNTAISVPVGSTVVTTYAVAPAMTYKGNF